MAQAVSRAAFARPARVAPRCRRPRVLAPRAGDSLRDGVSTETPEETRRQMAREVIDAMFQVGGPLESRLLRLPVPRAPPPPALMALASAREPRRSLNASLHPRRLRVPDVENALRCRCELTPSARVAGGRRMRCRASNAYVADLFAIVGGVSGQKVKNVLTLGGEVGFSCDVHSASSAPPSHRLSRFDLFHAHVFADADTETVGLLFHASEYPAFDPEAFPHHLGYCQTDSTCAFDERKHSRRNVLWVARRDKISADESDNFDKKVVVAFAALDTSRAPEKERPNPLHDALLSVRELHTTFEGDFGDVAGDLLYLHELRDRKPKHRVFAFAR